MRVLIKQVKDNHHTGNYHVDILGAYCFRSYKELNPIKELLEQDGTFCVTVNLSDIQGVDSSLFGIFLILDEEAKKRGVRLIFQNPPEKAEKIFKAVHYPFQVQYAA